MTTKDELVEKVAMYLGHGGKWADFLRSGKVNWEKYTSDEDKEYELINARSLIALVRAHDGEKVAKVREETIEECAQRLDVVFPDPFQVPDMSGSNKMRVMIDKESALNAIRKLSEVGE
jgi:hypothetical protein